jgi:shikimate dehydrogenase
MKKFAVIGYPLSHSLSPQMHNTAFRVLNMDAHYEKLEIAPDSFDETIRRFKEDTYSGFNVTIPHKTRILDYMDEVDSDAAAVGAMNTVVIGDGHWTGYNTDIAGFTAPLAERKAEIKRVLILGNGGAARAVIYALIKYISADHISVAGRDLSKPAQLCEHFRPSALATLLQPLQFTAAEKETDGYDLIVNTTPLGMAPRITGTPLPGLKKLKKNSIVYDLIYNPAKTRLLMEAEKAGKDIVTINGLEMLLQQAAHSFRLWTGQEMPLAPVRQSLLTALK